MKKTMAKKKKRNRKPITEGRINEGNFLSAVIDNENNQIRVYSKDMLLKRINRDSVRIGKSFDRLCKNDLTEMSELFSKTNFYIGDGLYRAVRHDNEMKITCSKLLMNAAGTIQASVELLRIGYYLQPGMMLRSVIETISTVAYFMVELDGYAKFKEGKFDVNKVIKYGKQVIPNLGYIQGLLSNHFVHISELHSELNGVTEYKGYTEPLRINLNLIRACIWSLYVVSELTFYDYFDEHTYWSKVAENEYKFEQTEQSREWMLEFFKEGINFA